MNIPPEAREFVQPFSEDQHDTFLRDFMLPIWKRLWIVGLVSIMVVGTAIGFTFIQTPLYEADIKVLIGQKQDSAPENLGSEIPGLQQLTQTMVEAASSRRTAEAVIQELDLSTSPETLLQDLNVEQIGATQFIEISYRDSNPQRAQQVVDTVGEVFSSQISEVSPSANAITATLWERAAVPVSPVSPDPLRNGLLALALGLMIGIGLVYFLEYLDDSWRSPEEVEQISGVPTFGVIPAFKRPKSRKATKK